MSQKIRREYLRVFSAADRQRDAGTLKSGLEFSMKEADAFIVISF